MSPGANNWPLGSGSVDPAPWKGPESGGGSASGIASLTHPGGTIARGAWTSVAAWRDSRPRATTVFVKTSIEAMTQLSGAVDEGSGVVDELGGVLRIVYGQGAALRTLEADIRSGSYQLPPSDFVTLDALLWKTWVEPLTVTVAGAIVPGFLATPSRLTSTQQLTMSPNATYTDTPPEGARWVSMAGGNPGGIGPGQPMLSFRQGQYGIYILQDYEAGVFIGQPGQAVELLSREEYTVRNLGSTQKRVTLRFFLEV